MLLPMDTLDEIAQQNHRWSLTDFVDVVNSYLPLYLPLEQTSAKVRDKVTARLIRHYTTQGMLDEPYKEGRQARYVYRHLLQTLVVRRLLTEGYASHVIGDLATSKRNEELEALLQGGMQVQVTIANPALTFLQQIQERESLPGLTAARNRSVQPQPTTPKEASTQWTRIEIARGLEIHISSDFPYPKSSHEQQNLFQKIRKALETVAQKRRSS